MTEAKKLGRPKNSMYVYSSKTHIRTKHSSKLMLSNFKIYYNYNNNIHCAVYLNIYQSALSTQPFTPLY